MKWYYLITIPLWVLSIPAVLIAAANGLIGPKWAAGISTMCLALVILGPWTWKNAGKINEAVYDRPFRRRDK